jgi:hypothetical protein
MRTTISRHTIPRYAAALVAVTMATVVSPAQAQSQPTALEQRCAQLVQGQVAWDTSGNRQWQPDNIARLCQGTSDPAQTIACFQDGIQRHGGWARAIKECRAGSGADAIGATGVTVHEVVVGRGAAKAGSFRDAGNGQWAELDAGGNPVFSFQETQRNSQSVSLLDASRGVMLRLDLAARRVLYTQGERHDEPIYRILAATTDVTGPPAAQMRDPQVEIAPVRQAAPSADSTPPPGAANASAPLDTRYAILRAGALNNDAEAQASCPNICRQYGGYSGRWAVVASPNWSACQCAAPAPAGVGANEIVTEAMSTVTDAARVCQAACSWYGGGDGTWRTLNATQGACGCAQQVAP